MSYERIVMSQKQMKEKAFHIGQQLAWHWSVKKKKGFYLLRNINGCYKTRTEVLVSDLYQ